MQGVKLCVCPCARLPVGARVCVCACVRVCGIAYTHNSHCDIEFSTENARTRVWIAEAAAIVCVEKSRERAKHAWAQVFVATAAISTPARSARPAQLRKKRNLANHFQHRSAGLPAWETEASVPAMRGQKLVRARQKQAKMSQVPQDPKDYSRSAARWS